MAEGGIIDIVDKLGDELGKIAAENSQEIFNEEDDDNIW